MLVQRKVVAAYRRLVNKVGDAWLHGILYACVSGGLDAGTARVRDCAANDASGDGAGARRRNPCHVEVLHKLFHIFSISLPAE